MKAITDTILSLVKSTREITGEKVSSVPCEYVKGSQVSIGDYSRAYLPSTQQGANTSLSLAYSKLSYAALSIGDHVKARQFALKALEMGSKGQG